LIDRERLTGTGGGGGGGGSERFSFLERSRLIPLSAAEDDDFRLERSVDIGAVYVDRFVAAKKETFFLFRV
jgi:hypothetical protein